MTDWSRRKHAEGMDTAVREWQDGSARRRPREGMAGWLGEAAAGGVEEEVEGQEREGAKGGSRERRRAAVAAGEARRRSAA